MKPLVAALAWLLVATPAIASPDPRPAYTDPGNHGVVIPYVMQGTLGVSGLTVQALPTMILVTAIASGSPAALVDLPSPAKYRVRLVAIDGVLVEDLPESALMASFGSDREDVALTIGRKGPDDAEEMLIGPFRVPLSSRAVNRLQAERIAREGKFGQALPFAQPGELAERTLLAAHEADAAADPDHARALASIVDGTTAERARAQLAKLDAAEDKQRELLDRADALASQGNFAGALKLLEGVADTGAFGDLRKVREQDWQRALEARKAMAGDADQRPRRPRAR